MTAFTWLDGERMIRFGRGGLEQAHELLGARGFDGYALLTTGRWRGAAAALEAAASVIVEVPGGGVADAAAAVREAVGSRPPVALGGGRVVDVAKALAGTAGVRCGAIPTTLSGAEMTGFHRLPAGASGGSMVRAALVVADPALMASQPVAELAASAMNGLAHAVEALYTPLANPVATLAALRSAELFASGLAAQPRDEDLSLAAILAGYAGGLTGFAVHHVVCQTLVRLAGTAHAQTNAAVLAHSVRLMAERAPAEIAALARALGGAEAADAAPLVERLARRTEIEGLAALGLDAGRIPSITEAVIARPELQATPRPPRADEVTRLIEASL